MRVLIAPDKFRGTLDAAAAADAIAAGCRSVVPGAEVEIVALSDGGEGFVDALVGACGGRRRRVAVSGPLGRPVSGLVGILDDGRVVIESASAAGLAAAGGELEPLRASTRGLGELILWARRTLPDAEIVVGVGGTATTDGATGAAAAAGWQFTDGRGAALPPGGGALASLTRIEPPERSPPRVAVAACDVLAPLTGPDGAARRFGPQKGAGPAEIEILEAGLAVLGARVQADIGVDVGVPGAGAGGGAGAGLIAFFGARISAGVEIVAEATGLAERIARADVVITGEGRLDAGTSGGKVPAGVRAAAAAAGVPCLVVAGAVDGDAARAFAGSAAAVDVYGDRALTEPAAAVAAAAAAAVRGFAH